MSVTPPAGSAQQFTWDVSGAVPQLLEDGTNYYLYGPNVNSAPIEQINIGSGAASYLLSDTTGVREQVNSSGTITGSMSYDSYGNLCSTCTISTPFGFEGGYTDPTGLIYLVNRYYDPATEQFMSVDPMVDETATPYAFVAGDPVNDTDPSGTLLRSANGTTCVDSEGCAYQAREEREQGTCLLIQEDIAAQERLNEWIVGHSANRSGAIVGYGALVGGGALATGTGSYLAIDGYASYTAGAASGDLFVTFVGGLGVATGGVIVVVGVGLIGYGISKLI
jgi:RHS repeat-associated protein